MCITGKWTSSSSEEKGAVIYHRVNFPRLVLLVVHCCRQAVIQGCLGCNENNSKHSLHLSASYANWRLVVGKWHRSSCAGGFADPGCVASKGGSMIMRKDIRVGISRRQLTVRFPTLYIKAHDFSPTNGERIVGLFL